jgi:hypothetical protein
VKVYDELGEPPAHLVMSGDGATGFVMGLGGVELQLERGAWRVPAEHDALAGRYLADVRLNSGPGVENVVTTEVYGQTALAIARSRWSWQALPKAPSTATAAAFSEDAKRGWAVGRHGAMYAYRDGVWQPDEEASRLTGDYLVDLCLSAEASEGWAIGSNGTVLALTGSSTWRRANIVQDHFYRSSELLCSEDASTALARGAKGYWRLPAQNLDQAKGSPLWVGRGRVAWFRARKVVIESDGEPDRTQTFNSTAGLPALSRAWMSSEASTGWSTSLNSGIFALRNGEWFPDEQINDQIQLTRGRGLAMRFPVDRITAIALSRGEDDGWAVGQSSMVWRYRPTAVPAIRMAPVGDASLSHLRGSFKLTFPAPLRTAPTVALYSSQRTDELSPVDYQITGGQGSYRLTFLAPAAERAEEIKGQKRAIEVRADYAHPSIPVHLTYRSEPFLVVGPSLLRQGTYLAAGVIGLNLLLLLGATRIPILRSAVLNPISANVFGLVIAKYLVTDQIIRHAPWVKLSLFREYRRNLAASPAILAWQDRPYVAPQISLQRRQPIPATEPPQPAWRQVFATILAQPKGRLWLVEGPSGLGKSALLERWLGLALELGQTPFLIALQGELSPQREAALLMHQYGQLAVSDDVALDLLGGGGFVLLLDGFNEDRAPEVTREFVQRVAKRNLVILTSQFTPPWTRKLDIQRIHLEAFGQHQLEQLLDPRWVAQVMASPLLAGMAQLPVTAQLLAGFVRRYESLPADRLEIYAGLTATLDHAKSLNLQAAAWNLFKTNEFEIGADAGLPKEFCDQAVTSGVLTAWPGTRYRFVHETINRYLTACYLDRQDTRPLIEWHQEVRTGLGRAHWIDVLDFWGEQYARRAMATDAEVSSYESFLKEAAVFDRHIFAWRLYPHYDQLCASGALVANAAFIAWSARLLAGRETDFLKP